MMLRIGRTMMEVGEVVVRTVGRIMMGVLVVAVMKFVVVTKR